MCWCLGTSRIGKAKDLSVVICFPFFYFFYFFLVLYSPFLFFIISFLCINFNYIIPFTYSHHFWPFFSMSVLGFFFCSSCFMNKQDGCMQWTSDVLSYHTMPYQIISCSIIRES
ncbi:hypothetical protein BDV29DRAFT_48352 [Aspergillus leporis]|uniref:Uncharacterized protein n=1 Tax=Aspergillus leporis TaxID=41062 RepID=A0A5N5WLU0_9EURO|nr:hypothetical protein BDV29DRAFT_48352 [Aspergillus leporis]